MSFFSERLKTGTKKRFILPDEPLPSSYYINTPRNVTKDYFRLIVPANVTFNDKPISLNAKAITYLGLVENGIGQVRYKIDEGALIGIKIGSINNDLIYLKPNDTFIIEENPKDIFITNNIADISFSHEFLVFNNLFSFFRTQKFGFKNTLNNLENYGQINGATGRILVDSILSSSDNLIGRVKITDDGTDIVKVSDTTSAPVNSDLGLHTIGRTYVWTGSAWVALTGSGAGYANVNVQNSPLNVTVVNDSSRVEYAFAASGGSGAGVTVTLVPQFGDLILNWYEIELYNVAARTGGATPISVTVSGFEDNTSTAKTFTHWFPTAGAIGTVERLVVIQGAKLFKATASTNIVITCPATANARWNVNGTFRDT